MKRIVILTVILFLSLLPVKAREYPVSGPEGGLAMKIALPDGFDENMDRCPMVILMHGTKDTIVPMWCSEQYLQTYGERATLVKVDGENHLITRRKKEILSRTVAFFRQVFE